MSTDCNLAFHLDRWSSYLKPLRQNQLLPENRFIPFAKDRGIPVFGVVEGDPGDFHNRGWLRSDGADNRKLPLFHPFRIFPLHRILDSCRLGLARSATLCPEGTLTLVEHLLDPGLSRRIAADAQGWNETANLAILLEPLYWPHIIGHSRLGDADRELLTDYRGLALDLVKRLDPKFWRERHEELRLQAAWLDDNPSLYLLLRASSWKRRQELKGRISGALWLRQIAEIIRLAFQEVHRQHWKEDDLWLEEDQAFGSWHRGGRRRLFGASRPLEHLDRSRSYLAHYFGLATGSAVRWYTEGKTEYYAIEQILGDREGFGIEPVNLHGVIERDQDNIALKLEEWLREDKTQKRFSMICFDYDRKQSRETVRRQITAGNLVGYVDVQNPDFEFHNFTAEELAEVAALIDEAHGFSGNLVRNADWTGINNGRDFEERYRRISERKPRSLKGETWGRALARYAREHPVRKDNGRKRPLIKDIEMALRARTSDYNIHAEQGEIDPTTFTFNWRKDAS